jgi:hypothetical protein
MMAVKTAVADSFALGTVASDFSGMRIRIGHQVFAPTFASAFGEFLNIFWFHFDHPSILCQS